MHKIDLNCDLGESFGNYKLGLDDEVIKYISSANIACGFHASDPLVMQKTVALARDNGVAVGAHPGFPDLVGFGRRNMNVSPAEAKAFATAAATFLLARSARPVQQIVVALSEMVPAERAGGFAAPTSSRADEFQHADAQAHRLRGPPSLRA